MARPIAREAAMQLVFEQLFGGEATAETLVDLIDYKPGEKDSTYINTVVSGVKEHAEQLDGEIAACLRGWTLARLSRVDLAIMRLAVYEMQYSGLPAAVAINEAVELTRKYSGEESCPFVNGVLGGAGMRAVLGIDTSCYTTSCALVTPEGEILSSSRRLLTVEDGARGLMQSQGLFQHVKNLPQMVQNVMADVSDAEICAVCASTRPRPAEDSYMPVFRAGESQARAAASLLRVPFYPASHQEGHVRAAMVDAGIDETKPFLALHLSGGTTEILLSEEGKLTLLGGSLDLHAGQLVDRTGVRLHMPFPAGPSLEKLAMEGKAQGLIGVSIKGVSCNMAGAENKVTRWIEGGDMPKAQIAAEVFDFLCRSILRMIAAAGEQTEARQALLAGGVASSTLLRGMLLERAKKTRLGCRLCFARPELSGDNAVGVALLGAEAYRAECRLHG